MTGKLKDYQVLDILCGGTFYKVRHKVTNKVFSWKAYDCSAYSDKQIQNVVSEVKTINKVPSDTLLRYYDTILHAPSKTLYFVLEFNSWQSLEQLITICEAADKYIAESFVWYLLLELARVSKAVENVNLVVLQTYVRAATIFVGERCELRINCFEPSLTASELPPVMRQVGDILHSLCARLRGACDNDIYVFHYSNDLRDIISFLTDARHASLRPDVVLYHPTVLANLDTLVGPKHLSEILLSTHSLQHISEANKCDSEKAVQLCRGVNPAPRTHLAIDSPIYSNISPKRKLNRQIESSKSVQGSLSPTLAALALELPGFVPRSRKPLTGALENYMPQKVSEETLSHQWMSRLIALRQREQSLNKRERDLIAKEIVNSPNIKIIPLNESLSNRESDSNGITLPPVITQAEEKSAWVSRRRQRRSSSVRPRSRRKSFGYEDLDSSLSADPGDGSMIITATKFTTENMPRRNIFPHISTKKVHFASANPFVESDESVTLTFYELENVDGEGYQVPRKEERALKDITKFKYLDLEKLTSEKRAAMPGSQPSPSKQPKVTNNIFANISNTNEGIKKTPSKASLTSKGSNSSRYSMASLRSQWSMESANSKVSEGSVSERTRSNLRQSVAYTPVSVLPPEVKKSKRKSLLPFKTPFKFMSSTKI